MIETTKAPRSIGTYSQAIKINNVVYISGQIPLAPDSMEIVSGDIARQIKQVFDNIKAIASASGGNLADIVKLTVFLTDISHFPLVNKVMDEYFNKPYPARSVVGIAELPKSTNVEIDAIMVIKETYSY